MNIYLVNGKEIEAETPEEAKKIFQEAYPYIINIFVKDIRENPELSEEELKKLRDEYISKSHLQLDDEDF